MFKKISIALLLFSSTLWSQDNKAKLIEIKQAASLSYDKSVTSARILKGDVICAHDGALLFCDTAYFYDTENRITAAGHIVITKGDSIRVTGDHLQYDGKTKMASLQGNVKVVEKDMTLTTGILTFDVGNSIANYFNGGTIVNRENTLTSKNGHYYSASKEATFNFDVVLNNPDYKMNSDTLRYKLRSKTAYFLGPSLITSKTDYIYCENGWYDTDKEKSQFSKNAVLVTKQQKLRGDSLLYDRNLQLGRAFRNVSLVDNSQKSVIYGNYIQYSQKNSEALVTNKAVYAKVLEKDTFFVAVDTLYHKDLDSVHALLNAFHHVRLFKSNLQAMCDSAALTTKDSLLQLFYTPILFTNHSQATAKIIRITVGNNQIRGFELDGLAFLAQATDSIRQNKFNQMLAKRIVGEFAKDTIRKITAIGNAEIYYYAKNQDKIMALNKTKGAEITAWFLKGDVSRVSIRSKTDGTVDPIKDVDTSNAQLRGFTWHYAKRPKSRFELHRH
jgi:lipopolysaccharide export system protein LptA